MTDRVGTERGSSWHVPSGMLRRYAGDGLGDADAWSVEAHLIACAACRAELAETVPGTASGQVVELVRDRLAGALPTQPQVVRATPGRGRLLLLAGAPAARAAWLLAAAVVLLVAVLLDAASGGTSAGDRVWWLVAPALPLLGVAACFGRGLDPAYEVVVATPGAGLRLVLWRALAVVLPTVLVTTAVGTGFGLPTPASWLLPCLGLTTISLLLGVFTGLARAAALVGAAWSVAVVAPGVTSASTSVSVPAAVQPGSSPVWLALVLGAAVGLVLTRGHAYRRYSS